MQGAVELLTTLLSFAVPVFFAYAIFRVVRESLTTPTPASPFDREFGRIADAIESSFAEFGRELNRPRKPLRPKGPRAMSFPRSNSDEELTENDLPDPDVDLPYVHNIHDDCSVHFDPTHKIHFDAASADYEPMPFDSHFDCHSTNPSSGLPMLDGIDTEGNPFGADLYNH